MQIDTYIIDTFTSVLFKGNPTVICYPEYALDPELMQSIALELNLPVTGFIQKRNATAEYDIDYFTPTTRIPACGHATLAAAKVVEIKDGVDTAAFYTIEQTRIETIHSDGIIMMHYPEYSMQKTQPGSELLSALGLTTYKTAGFCEELETLFIEIEDPAILKALQPDISRLVRSSDTIKEVVITSVSDNGRYDYLLRSFCPWIGIDEDPVTGSVHTVLAGFWKERLGKDKLKAFQASERGGELFVNVMGGKTGIGGNTVIILSGKMDFKA